MQHTHDRDALPVCASVSVSTSACITCCYDKINGIQDLEIYSHADFLILSTSASAQYCGFRRYCIDANKDALFSL